MVRMHNPAHPGEVLRDGWPEHITITHAAKSLGVTRAALSRILNGKAAISADMALRLETWLGIQAEVWLGMQTQFDLWKASQTERTLVEPVGIKEGVNKNDVLEHRADDKSGEVYGPKIKVIGVGGCGVNAVDHMMASGLEGVEFICANTDAQSLKRSRAGTLLQLGASIAKGLGAGGNTNLGREAAIEDRENIAGAIYGADMLFIIAGMGGGTGTGAAPIVAEVAKELGVLTVAVVTTPFAFEGKRLKVAATGIEDLSKDVDSLIVIPNDKLIQVLGDGVSLLDAFKAANDVLHGTVSGITEMFHWAGLVNVDFADVRTVMSQKGMGMVGSAYAAGVDRACVAAKCAVNSPLLEGNNLAVARGILVNITASTSLKMKEYYDVMEVIKEFTAEDATVIVGTVIEENMGDDLRVTIIASGIDGMEQRMLEKSMVHGRTGTYGYAKGRL